MMGKHSKFSHPKFYVIFKQKIMLICKLNNKKQNHQNFESRRTKIPKKRRQESNLKNVINRLRSPSASKLVPYYDFDGFYP